MSITGRLSSKADHLWPSIINMDRTDFPNPWTISDWESLDMSRHLLMTACDNGELVGFSLFGALPDDEAAHLLKICLRPELRGSGSSLQFWGLILEELRNKGISRVFLEVALTNGRANGFYRKIGFRDLRVHRGYYSNGDDALSMELTL